MRILLLTLPGCWVLSDSEIQRHDEGLPRTTPDIDTGPAPSTTDFDSGLPPTTPAVACGAVAFTPLGSWDLAGAGGPVAAGDLDGDGANDLAVADTQQHAVAVALGDGRGGFRALAPLQLDGAACPDQLVIGSFLGGGRPGDLAIADPCNDAVWIVRLEGERLVEALQLEARRASTLATATLDGDDVADLVVGTSDGLVDAHLREGLGFETGPQVDVGGALEQLAAGDLDGDGVVDVLALDADAPSRIHVLGGVGDGSFVARSPLTPAEPASRVDVADADGDGVGDVITSGGATIEVFASGAPAASRVTTLGAAAGEAAFADFLQEGCTSALALLQDPPRMQWLRGLGDGNFEAVGATPLPDAPDHLVVAQFDDPASPLDVAVVSGSLRQVLVYAGGAP